MSSQTAKSQATKTAEKQLIINECVFSPCREYRYSLMRDFGSGEGMVAFIGLNPSTADEYQNDPTVSRCMNRAEALGFRRFVMLNAYGYRATDPKDMKSHPDPVGDGNDKEILRICRKADKIICCWGNHAAHLGRSDALRKLLEKFELFRLGKSTAQNEPRHPLYLPKATELEAMNDACMIKR